MYCQGSGRVEANSYKAVDEIMEKTRVVYCAACGEQNRVQEKALSSIALTCHKCKAELFNPGVSPFDLPPFQRRKA
jgi:NADH pyrophosphatase NudC (nudix superfamily)